LPLIGAYVNHWASEWGVEDRWSEALAPD
jgi:hypothetical protein